MVDYQFLLELAIIIFSTKLFGVLMKKLGLPQVVGALLAGLIIGPVLHWVRPNTTTLKVIAELGVIMIMFTAGLETSIRDIKDTGLAAFLVAMMGVIVPLILGFVISAAFHGGFVGIDTDTMLQNVFVGVILTATSVSITVETLREMGKLKTRAGTTILSAAILDDIIGIIILSVIIGLRGSGAEGAEQGASPLIAILKTAAFFVCAIGAGIGLHYLFKFLAKRFPNRRRVPIFAFVICLLYAYCAERFFGVADITGAYLAGIVLSGIKVSDYIEKKIDINAYMIFSPVFFASIGINASFDGFNLSILWFAVSFVAVGILGKIIGCYAASRMLRMSRRDSFIIGVGMIARGEVCLIVMQKGINAKLMPDSYLVMGVMLVIISSILAPILLRLLYRKDQGGDASVPPSEPVQLEMPLPDPNTQNLI